MLFGIIGQVFLLFSYKFYVKTKNNGLSPTLKLFKYVSKTRPSDQPLWFPFLVSILLYFSQFLTEFHPFFSSSCHHKLCLALWRPVLSRLVLLKRKIPAHVMFQRRGLCAFCRICSVKFFFPKPASFSHHREADQQALKARQWLNRWIKQWIYVHASDSHKRLIILHSFLKIIHKIKSI